MSRNLRLHHSLATDGTPSPCPGPSKAFDKCGRRVFQTDSPDIQPYFGSRLNPSICCFFQGPQNFSLLVFTQFRSFHCLVQVSVSITLLFFKGGTVGIETTSVRCRHRHVRGAERRTAGLPVSLNTPPCPNNKYKQVSVSVSTCGQR